LGRDFVYNVPEVKKVITILSLSSVGIILGYLSLMSGLLGFLAAKYLAGNTDGKPGRIKSFTIPLGSHKLHLHHWLLSLGIIALGLIKSISFIPLEVFCGFLGGLALQGIYCYNDWHKILVPRYLVQGPSDSEALSELSPGNTLIEGPRGDAAEGKTELESLYDAVAQGQ
jgi:hypothetical protein